MGVGLSGNLVDFGIADVFQLIGQQRKTGLLELRSGSSRARLVFDRGLIVSAAPAGGRAGDVDPLADMLVRCGLLTRERAEEAMGQCRASAQTLAQLLVERSWLDAEIVARIEDLLTRDTIFEVLRWHTGSFDFRGQEVHHQRDPASLLGAEQILMDGLRMVDEWQSFAELIPSEDTVFQRVGRFETYRQHTRRESESELAMAQRVFSLVDARLDARRVVDLSQLGTFDGMRCLADLRQCGVIKPLNPEGVRHLRRAARPAGDRDAWLPRVLAAAVPLLLLAGVAGWTWTEASHAVAPAAGHPIERADLAALREASRARSVRHAVEAWRLEHGSWPVSLEALRGAYGLEGTLAAPDGRPYYSRVGEGGLIVLAPER